jgi:Fur family peroxide stress response transcriptional regulator
MLESMGVIDTFTVDDKLRIDQPTPHINVYCKNTGKVFDVDGQVMEALSTMLRERGIQVKKAIVEANCP